MKIQEGNSIQKTSYDNEKRIEKLEGLIKPWYKCVSELDENSISIAISLTNCDESTKEGFLVDTKGKLFKITGGDGYALLLEYYTQLNNITIQEDSGGDTPSGSGSSLTIKKDYEIGYSDKYQGLMFASILPDTINANVFLYANATTSPSTTIQYTTYSSPSSSSSKTYFNYAIYNGTYRPHGFIGIIPVASTVIVPKKFTDKEGNERYGYVGAYALTQPQESYRIGVVFFPKYPGKRVPITNTTSVSVYAKGSYKILCFDTLTNDYITIENYEQAGSASSTQNGYVADGGISIMLSYNLILCGILEADVHYVTSNSSITYENLTEEDVEE